MKHYYFLTLIFLFCFSNISSQDYEPVIKEGSFWDVEEVLGGYCSSAYYRHQIDNDTIINGKTYKKLLYSEYSKEDNSSTCPTYKTPFSINYSDFIELDEYIREAPSEKKVYIWSNKNTDGVYKEYILYDFNLKVDDILDSDYYAVTINQSNNRIVKKDTNQEGKTRLHLVENVVYYTEGVGSYSGITSFNRVVGVGDRTLFCWGDSQNQNDCARVLSIEDNFFNQTSIYPNPVKDKLFIKNLELNSKLELHSISGKKLNINIAENNLVNLEDYETGIYFLTIIYSNKRRKVIKIIKK